jgi:hypothetical protein
VFEEEAGRLVDGGELGEVAGVGARCAEDEAGFFAEAVFAKALGMGWTGGKGEGGKKSETYVPERKSMIMLCVSRQR